MKWYKGLVKESFLKSLSKVFKFLLLMNVIINIDDYQSITPIRVLDQLIAKGLSTMLQSQATSNQTTLIIIQDNAAKITWLLFFLLITSTTLKIKSKEDKYE